MTSRRALVLSTLIVLVALIAAPAPARVRSFRSASPAIADPGGRVVVLHGFNMVWKTAPYYPPSSIYPAPFGVAQSKTYFDERDAQLLADHGFNVVRLGLIWKGLEPKRGVFDDAYLDRMSDLIGLLRRYGINVLLDFHQDMANEQFQGEGFPDWAIHTGIDTPAGEVASIPATNCCGFPGNYFTPAVGRVFDNIWNNAFGLWSAYADAWAHVAARLGGKSNVIGYDVMNEPWPGTQWPTCVVPIGCPAFEDLLLQPFFEQVARAIRAVQPAGIVFWEPVVMNDFGTQNTVGLLHPFADPNNGLSFHAYCLIGGQFVQQISRAQDPECQQTEPMVFTNQKSAGARNGAALGLTEFGASDDLVDIGRVKALADESAISWFFWQYQGWSDPTGNPAGEGMSAKDDQQRFATLKQAKLALLTETYPQAVAGVTPSWQASGVTFTLTYTAARTFPEVTEIYVDASRFTSSATGALPVPCPSARPHVICFRNTVSSGTVTITITRT
jgi:endoglycosylceramidase